MNSKAEALSRPWHSLHDIFGPGRRTGETRKKEQAEIVGIRNIRREDLLHILKWVDNPLTTPHLDPLPTLPKSWSDQKEVEGTINELQAYYENFDDDPAKIIPLVATNAYDEPVGVLTIRLRGDPYVPPGKRIASVERLIVEPDLRHLGIGERLFTVALMLTFDKYKGFNGEGAREVRVWIMSDDQADDYSVNQNFFRKFGFKPVQGQRTFWKDFAEKRGIETNRDAQWWSLKQEGWEEFKKNNPTVFSGLPQIDYLSLKVRT